MKKQKQRYFRVTLPEVGLELVYDADASPPDDLTANQYELAKYVALYLSLHSLIETLETKKELAQEGFLKLAGKGIGYIRKRHGRKRKPKTIGAYVNWDIDLDRLRTELTEAGRHDIYDQSIRRGAPGRFIAPYTDGNREEVLADLELLVEHLGVQITPFGQKVETFVHMPTLRKLCAPEGIKLRDVRKPSYTIKVYEEELAES